MKPHYLIGIVLGQQFTLHQSARNADLSCLDEISDWSVLNEHGSNALHSALQGDNENGQMAEMVAQLLDKGVSTDLVNANGFLPAHALYRNALISEEDKLTILAKMAEYGAVPASLPWLSAFGLKAIPPPKMSLKLQAAATFYSLFPEYSSNNECDTSCESEEKLQQDLDQAMGSVEQCNSDVTKATAAFDDLVVDFEKAKEASGETETKLSDEINDLKLAIVKLSEPKPEKVCVDNTPMLNGRIVELETALTDAQNALSDKMTQIEEQAKTIDELKIEEKPALVEIQLEPCQCPGKFRVFVDHIQLVFN